MKKMLKSTGLVCPHLSRKFTYLLLLLVTLIGGANSAWAEEVLQATFPGDNTGFTCNATTSTASGSGYTLNGQTVYAVAKSGSIQVTIPSTITVTKVEVLGTTSESGGNDDITVSNDHEESTTGGFNKRDGAISTIEFTPTQKSSTITIANGNTRAIWIQYIKIYTSGSPVGLVPFSIGDVFVADNITNNGTVSLSTNSYYFNNKIQLIGTGTENSTANNKGSSTFNDASHLNSLRVKNTQDCFKFSVSEPCTVTFYTESHASRGLQLGTENGGTQLGKQSVNTSVWKVDIASAGEVYVSSYEGDFYIAGFTVMAQKKTITFNANGGSGEMSAQEVNSGEATALNANTFAPANGFSFVGWNTAADGTGTEYTPGQSVTLTEDLTLYAQWFRFSPQGGQSEKQTLIAGGSSVDYYFILQGSKELSRAEDQFEISVDNSNVSVVYGGNSVDGHGNKLVYFRVTPNNAGSAVVTVKYKGNGGLLYTERTQPVTFTIKGKFNVSISNEIEGGTVTTETDLSSPIVEGTNVTFTANAEDWYQIDNWYNEAVSPAVQLGGAESEITVPVSSDLIVKANFARYYKIATSATNGTVTLKAGDEVVTSDTEIKSGTALTAIASHATNYHFVKWQLDGVDKEGNETLTISKVQDFVGASTTEIVTLTAVFEEDIVVDPTKVGEDNTTDFNSVHSEVKELAAGMTRHITFTNHSNKEQNWNNWILNVGSTNDKAKTPDVMQLRADEWELVDNANTGKVSNFNWGTFKDDMDGATVAMDVTNSGKHIYVNATITTTGGTKYNYSAISSDKLVDATAYICLTVEKAHLTDLNIGDETQAYELTYAMNELGTSTYNDSYGKVTIKNAQGLALRKGTYVPSGEVVKYKAENFDDPRYVFVKWASGYTDAERDITVAEDAVNPCAVFLDKPGVTTPENIVTLSHPAIGTDGFKMYFTLDNSDPKTSASRYEYSASNLVAIRENIGKVRAVAYIDGVYSVIQGTNVTYKPVTVLEARGGTVEANSTFTGNTNTTSVKFGGNVTETWTNAKSPNSSVDVDEKVYRGQDTKFTIGLNSTSAYKFVIGYTSGGSNERGLTVLSVDGNSSTYTSNGVKANSQTEVKRLVISPTSEIEQGSEVTFTFEGNVGIAYIEVFGTSLEKQCEAPTIAPYEYDATNGWSYQIIPVEGTTLNYSVNGAAVQTSTTGATVTISATDIAAGQTIKVWSTKDGWGGSTRNVYTDADAIEPVLKFSPSATATYNKANTSWVGGVPPTLKIYPTNLIGYVTYATDDATVGNGTNGTSTITIGSGQGVATITASVTLEARNGFKAGTYTKALQLTLADGYAQQLGAKETPEVQGKRYVYDDSGNKILTLTYGGWNHGDLSNPTKWTASSSGGGTAGVDRWPAPKDDSQLTPIDGYKYNSQMVCDARDEIKAKVEWQSNISANDYTKVNPFSMPCRGAYITVVPECNGQLTIYLVQNGCVDANGNIVSDPYSRVYYWYDEDGDVIPPTSVTIKGDVTTGRKRSDYQSTINTWLSNITSEAVRNKLKSDIEAGWPDVVGAVKHPIPYCGGYFLPEKDYIKYVVQLVAGRTYYFFSNGSKMGYSGLNFAPSAGGSITVQKPEGGDMTITTQYELALSQNTAFVAPVDMTTYKTVTLDRKFAADTWNTICLPFHVSEDRVKEIFGDGTQLIIYDGMVGNTAKFKYHVHQDILAGQAYFIKPTKEIAANTLEFNNVTIKNGQSVYNNGSDGSDGTFSFVGTFGPTQINAYDHYTNAAGNITYFQSGSITMPGYRAYLQNHTVDGSSGAKVISGIQLFNAFDDLDDDAVTGIMEVIINDMHAVFKPVRGVYNLSGVKVGDTTEGLPAGIYIMDGRKVSIK